MDWFGLSQVEAEQLWRLRNAASYSYRLNNQQVVVQFGHTRLIRQTSSGYWEFYLHAMYTALTKAKRDIHAQLSGESFHDKVLT